MYLSNIRIRGIDDPDYEYNEEKIDELKKCAKDPLYFILNYIKIIDGDVGLINFQPRPYSVEFIKTIHANNYSLVKFPRQSGKCVLHDTFITIKVKGIVKKITLSDFYDLLVNIRNK